jgi:hypothetical protein
MLNVSAQLKCDSAIVALGRRAWGQSLLEIQTYMCAFSQGTKLLQKARAH